MINQLMNRLNSMINQFQQSLIDNLLSRFPGSDLLTNAAVQDSNNWPTDVVERAFYGDSHVTRLCKMLQLPSQATIDILMHFSQYRKNWQRKNQAITKLKIMLMIYPLSSADCERGISVMNRQYTNVRNRLDVTRVGRLLMIEINGPPSSHWQPRSYVLSWLKQGHHSANDKTTGCFKVEHEVRHSSKLFCSQNLSL